MKGRKPKPAALRLLQGAPLRKLQKAHGAALTGLQPLGDPPEWLDSVAADAWRSALSDAPAGLLTALDRGVMTAHCCALAMLRAATLDVQANGRYTTTASGTPMLAPAVRVQNAAAAAVLRAASELGLTPVARQRVAIAPQAADDAEPWAKFALPPDDPAA